MQKIEITGNDWPMHDWPPEELTVESITMPLEQCGSDDDPAAVVDAYGRELKILGVRRNGDRVELVIDTEMAAQ
jgi:hypothetical protein